MEVTKEQLIFSRGEGGSLLPQEVVLETVEGQPTIKIIPLTRGKLQEIIQNAESKDPAMKVKADTDVIVNGLVSPVLTETEMSDIKPQMASAIVTAILAISTGVSQKVIGEKTQEIIQEQELLLAKK